MNDSDCAVCQHSRVAVSDIESEGPILKCHRYPPTMFVLDGEVTQAHPDATGVCGEWMS